MTTAAWACVSASLSSRSKSRLSELHPVIEIETFLQEHGTIDLLTKLDHKVWSRLHPTG